VVRVTSCAVVDRVSSFPVSVTGGEQPTNRVRDSRATFTIHFMTMLLVRVEGKGNRVGIDPLPLLFPWTAWVAGCVAGT
jgi:hypothetical protein